jgi:RNA polymerase sigma-70 factor (ECF subfamily)
MMQTPVSACADLPDSELIALANQSDQRAFAALWNRHHARLLQCARRIVRNDADAQEVVQDAWFNAWRHLARFEQEARFSPWLIAIVRNLSLMKLRSRWRRRVVPIEPEWLSGDSAPFRHEDKGGNPEQAFELVERRRLVREQIARLPQPYGQCLAAAYLDDCPVMDAAKRLNLTESALKGRLRRGKAELRQRIGNGIAQPHGALAASARISRTSLQNLNRNLG